MNNVAVPVRSAWRGIDDGRVVRIEERLIRRRDMRISSFNIAVHGIRPEHVDDAGEFPQVMDEFADDFRGLTMIAHNARSISAPGARVSISTAKIILNYPTCAQ